MIKPPLTHIKQFGESPLTFNMLDPGFSFFEMPHGLIAYKKKKFLAQTILSVCGDPIADTAHHKTLLNSFVLKFPNAAFYHITHTTALHLKALGFKTNPIGHLHTLDLTHFIGSWKTHRSLMRHANQAKQNKIVIKEAISPEYFYNICHAISEEWLHKKTYQKELHFLLRPMSKNLFLSSRVFLAYWNHKIIAFKTFTPLYKNNSCIGYYQDLSRYLPSSPKGTTYLLSLEAIKKFQSEGIFKLDLGLTPFSHTLKTPLDYCFAIAKKTLKRVYPCSGIANYKNRFHGHTSLCYMASKNPMPILNLWGTLLMLLKP